MAPQEREACRGEGNARRWNARPGQASSDLVSGAVGLVPRAVGQARGTGESRRGPGAPAGRWGRPVPEQVGLGGRGWPFGKEEIGSLLSTPNKSQTDQKSKHEKKT